MPGIRSRLQKSVWGIATKEIIFKMLKVMHRSKRKYCSKKDQNFLSLCKIYCHFAIFRIVYYGQLLAFSTK